MIDLTEEQIERYSRHILLQDVKGLEVQESFSMPRCLSLVPEGSGFQLPFTSLRLAWDYRYSADADAVDRSNLQRQVILHQTKDSETP